jgi:hypothetical protein
LQISKFILLDALAPGNWLGAQSEENNRARMVALYKVEAEGSLESNAVDGAVPASFFLHIMLEAANPSRSLLPRGNMTSPYRSPAALSVVSIVVAPVALLKYGVLSARLNISRKAAVSF